MKVRDFVAIDFETANHHRSSICSVGMVVVRNGEIVESANRLVRPTPNFYSYWNTEVHGITQEMTDEAPTFPEVWEELSQLIGNLPLIAHNKNFDEGCLRAVHEKYAMVYPEYPFLCTYLGARRYFGNALVNHKLPTVAKHCGFDLIHHHDALADAEACAWIALNIEF